MSRVQLIEPDRATDPKVIAVYDSILSELGFGIVPNLFKSMAGRPGFLAANWDKFRTTVLEGQLPRTLKEMIGIAISQTNKSEYALRVHLHGLSALGISEDEAATLLEEAALDGHEVPAPRPRSHRRTAPTAA